MHPRRAAAERKIDATDAHGFTRHQTPGNVVHEFDRFSKARLVASD
jgi:hypothetical protein